MTAGRGQTRIGRHHKAEMGITIQVDSVAVLLKNMPFGPQRLSFQAREWSCLRQSRTLCNRRQAVQSSSSEVDIGLLQRIAMRDEAALAALYDRHSRLAYSVIMRILGSPSDAEDVLQDTFVRVWSRADTYNAGLGAPATWLARIARNRAIDRLRARRVQGPVAIESAVPRADGPRAGEPVTRDTPETLLVDNATADAVRGALATLTPAQRVLIEAAFFEGHTHSELATRFGVPLGTVKTRIRTGLATMRDHLEQVT
jgi:RNA polymerase sigma-70 factor (ECF subfamily)